MVAEHQAALLVELDSAPLQHELALDEAAGVQEGLLGLLSLRDGLAHRMHAFFDLLDFSHQADLRVVAAVVDVAAILAVLEPRLSHFHREVVIVEARGQSLDEPLRVCQPLEALKEENSSESENARECPSPRPIRLPALAGHRPWSRRVS